MQAGTADVAVTFSSSNGVLVFRAIQWITRYAVTEVLVALLLLLLLLLSQDLATGGRSIATTIHQPSGRLYQKLDKLMLLAEGHMMYYGKAHEVGLARFRG